MKRWSTLSLLKIQESDNSTLKNLLIGFDEFHLNWAMRKINEQNNEFQDMKRFRWSLKGEKLIQINALVIDFLKESGEPKNHASIEKYIEAERGTLSTFQIHITKNWPELIRLDTGLYGIRSRDLNLSEQDESLILKTILDALASEKIEKIDSNEIQEVLAKKKIDLKISISQIGYMLQRYVSIRKEDSKFFFIKFRKNKEYFSLIKTKNFAKSYQEYLAK